MAHSPSNWRNEDANERNDTVDKFPTRYSCQLEKDMSSLSSVDIETRERERTSLGIFINFHQYVVEDLVSFLLMLKLSFPGFRRYLHTILKNGNGLESSTALRADHQTYETEILTLLNFSGKKKRNGTFSSTFDLVGSNITDRPNY